MITASIVIYKTSLEELHTVLQCVVDSSVERVFVVDNSPTDELHSFAAISPKIEYIFGHGNVGYGAAHNIAIHKSIEQGATYHIVVNPDIYFDNGTIEKLAQYMDKNPNVGQVMPKVIYPNGELQYLCKLLPTPMDLIGRRFISSKSYIERRNYNFEMRGSGYGQTMEVPFLSGCFMFLRVAAIEQAGGFSDRYFMYCEDLDLCRRIGKYYKTVYYPVATVVHAHKKESFKNRRMLIEHIKSAIKYFNHWGWVFDKYRRQKNSATAKQYNNI